jgi:hypothetical protein
MCAPEQIRLIVGFRRVLLRFTCPAHAWNWPRLAKENAPEGFDAHQTCFKCSVERAYSTTRLESGPLYRSLVPGENESPMQRLAAILRSTDSKYIRGAARAMGAIRSALRALRALREALRPVAS